MTTNPYLPLFVDAYETDTLHLTVEQDGMYSRLLRLMWRSPQCQVPKDPEWLQRRLRINSEQYADLLLPILEEFCTIGRKFVSQDRLKREWEHVNSISRKNRRAAKSRWRKDKVDANAVPENSDTHMPDAETTYPFGNAPKPKPKPKPTTAGDAAPDGLDPTAIIAAFDEARIAVYGPENARPYPAGTDTVSASRLIEMGFDTQTARAMFQHAQQRQADQGKAPIATLRYFEGHAQEFLARPPEPERHGAPKPIKYAKRQTREELRKQRIDSFVRIGATNWLFPTAEEPPPTPEELQETRERLGVEPIGEQK